MSDSTYESVAEAHGVSMLAKPIPASENPFGQSFGSGSRHFSIRLIRPGVDREPFQCFYAQGSGIDREPSAADLLECLVLDMLTYEEEMDYWDHVDTFGSTPSREGQKHYELGVAQSRRFIDWADGELLVDLVAVES